MERKQNFDRSLLRRFFENQCTDTERQAVLEWLANPKNKALARQSMEEHWSEIVQENDRTEVDIEMLLAKTQQKIPGFATMIPVDRQNSMPGKTKNVVIFSWRLAATLTGVLFAVSALIFFFPKDQNQTQFLTVSENGEVKSKGDVQEIRSSSEQIIEQVLPDGTRVWLNAQSTLTVPSDFSGLATREVVLKGEAFFDVAEDKNHPFIVRTQGVNIVVLGTAFNIKSYQGDPTIETTLVRGKVVIENNKDASHNKVELKPNQRAVFSYATESITLQYVKINEPTTWNNGSLEFEDDALYSVIKAMERWYGVTIYVEDKSNMSCRLTARIDKESLVETLEVLKSLTGIHYTISDKNVLIKGKICEQ